MKYIFIPHDIYKWTEKCNILRPVMSMCSPFPFSYDSHSDKVTSCWSHVFADQHMWTRLAQTIHKKYSATYSVETDMLDEFINATNYDKLGPERTAIIKNWYDWFLSIYFICNILFTLRQLNRSTYFYTLQLYVYKLWFFESNKLSVFWRLHKSSSWIFRAMFNYSGYFLTILVYGQTPFLVKNTIHNNTQYRKKYNIDIFSKTQ